MKSAGKEESRESLAFSPIMAWLFPGDLPTRDETVSSSKRKLASNRGSMHYYVSSCGTTSASSVASLELLIVENRRQKEKKKKGNLALVYSIKKQPADSAYSQS